MIRTFLVTKHKQKIAEIRAAKNGLRYNVVSIEEHVKDILEATDIDAVRRIIETGQPAHGDPVEMTKCHGNGNRSLFVVTIA